MDIFFEIFKVIFYLIFIILLIYISLRFSKSHFKDLRGKGNIEVIEKVQISKENALIIIKFGDKGYLLNSSPKGVNTIEKLSQEEIDSVIKKKEERAEESAQELNRLMGKFNVKGRLKGWK